MLSILTLTSLLLSIKYHIWHNNSTFWKNTLRLFIFLSIFSIVVYLPITKTQNYNIAEIKTNKKFKFSASVLEIKQNRYNQKATISLQNDTQKAILSLPNDPQLKTDDKINGIGNLIPISSSDKNYFKYVMENIQFKLYSKKIKIIKQNKNINSQKISKNISTITSKIWEGNTLAIVNALLLGNRKGMLKEKLVHFKRSGVLHSLAASGMHVGIVVMIPFLLMGFLRINKKVIFIFAILSAFSYLYITNFPVSLLRAFIMFSIFATGKIINRDLNIFNTLTLSVLIIILLRPEELTNMGFQLSVGATAGIILFFSYYKKLLKKLPSFIQTSLALTISAQIFIVPIIAIHMGEINFTGLLANIVIIPLITILFISSIFTFSISFVSINLASYAGKFTDLLSQLTYKTVEIFSNIDGHFTLVDNKIYLIIPMIFVTIPIVNRIIINMFPIKIWNPSNIKINFLKKFYPLLLITTTIIISWTYLYSTNIKSQNISKIFSKDNKKVELIISDNKRNNP